jgi:sulfate adenylyltransferase
LAGVPLPHGGKLVNRFVYSDRSKNDKIDDGDMLTVEVSNDLRNDIENIASGIFSPLEGFVNEDDFLSIVKQGRLKNGLAWTIPIVLDVDEQTGNKMKDAGQLALMTAAGERFALLNIEQVYSFDRLACANSVYHTDDTNHPGVDKMVNKMKSHLAGGQR